MDILQQSRATGTDEAARRVLVQERKDPDGRVLPGRFLRQRHTVVDTVQEVFERKVHEAVIGEELHNDNFARRMKPRLKPVVLRGEVLRSSAT